jgi:hypothetical protein
MIFKNARLIVLMITMSSTMVCAQNIYDSKFQWKIPGGKYINPVSFFSLHGYVNGVFAGPSAQWTASNFSGIGMPGQVLVPNTNNSSFQNDEALFISSEITDNTSILMELHLVASPSGNGMAGPGGLTIVLTEANANWKIYKNYANISIGTFWSPFGIHNQDWLGAQNLFSLMPMASGAYPTHYNEKGIRLDGLLSHGENWGLNYVMSLGNGYDAWDISGYTSWDMNENKTFNSRVSIFPGFGEKFNLGFSYANGLINEGDTLSPMNSSTHYDLSFNSIGIDLKAITKIVELRGYAILTKKNYQSVISGSVANDNVTGIMGEISKPFKFKENKLCSSIVPKLRWDYLLNDINLFTASEVELSTISFGMNFHINKNFRFSVDYNVLNEIEDFNNNRLITRVSAVF